MAACRHDHEHRFADHGKFGNRFRTIPAVQHGEMNKMLNVEPLGWNRLGSTDLLEAGHQLGKSELLFEKIEDSVIEAQVQKLLDTKKANEEANYKAKPIRENIEFDDFMKLDIRVGDRVGMYESA